MADGWIFLDVPDLSVRRKVNCANVIVEKKGEGTDELRRYVQALDLSERRKSSLFGDWSPTPQSLIQPIVDEMSPSQTGAWEYLRENKHPLALIQGPPGTGKTTFGTFVARIATALGIFWSAFAPSNGATDHFASSFQKADPQMATTRYHPQNNEVQAIGKFEQAYGDPDSRQDEPSQPEESPEQAVEDAEARQSFLKLFVQCETQDLNGSQHEIHGRTGTAFLCITYTSECKPSRTRNCLLSSTSSRKSI